MIVGAAVASFAKELEPTDELNDGGESFTLLEPEVETSGPLVDASVMKLTRRDFRSGFMSFKITFLFPRDHFVIERRNKLEVPDRKLLRRLQFREALANI